MRNVPPVPGVPEWAESWRSWLESFENGAATGAERLVGGEAFAELLVHLTENVVALTRISADVYDLVLRNLRLAGRADIGHLARQIARSEDKLERLLQAVDERRDWREDRIER
jgi:hypothetical protein